MKKLLSIILAVIFTLSAGISAFAYNTGTYKVKYQGTNIRSGPGLGNSVVTMVNSGTQVNVTKVSGEWGYIPSLNGWLRLNGFADYIGSSTSSSEGQSATHSGSQADAIVSKAASQVGYVETTYSNGGFYSIYGDWYGLPYSAWCAMFVSWAANKAGIPESTVPKFASCGAGVNWFKNAGRWHNRSGYTPAKGDIIFFTDNGYSPYHVGIVEYVSGDTVHTIEGNVHDGSWKNYGVRRRSYNVNSTGILGYGSPAYF